MSYAEYENNIRGAVECPYDERPHTDVAHLTALAVLDNLCGRGGIQDELAQVDTTIRVEIVDELAALIRHVLATR